MRRLLLLTTLLLCFGLSSCQCSDKPDIGPVEGEDEQAQVMDGPETADAPTALRRA